MESASIRSDILRSALSAESFLSREQFLGWDPYDALKSPIFRLPIVGRWAAFRRVAQQLVKRSPINVRPLLAIPKGCNPVTLGLALHAYSDLATVHRERKSYYADQARWCIERLLERQSPGYAGACWGYDFDWQTREGVIPARTPTVVATGFVTNGLFHAFQRLNLDVAFDLVRSACDFVTHDLPYVVDRDDAICWSYSPLAQNAVLNATMKGTRLCAQAYSVTGEARLREFAERSARFVATRQRPDGSWPYAVSDARTWADNFHTGYVLDCFLAYQQCTGDSTFAEKILRGWNHYRERFFTAEAIPKYFAEREFPIDSTACAQSILTLRAFGSVAMATKVAMWSIAHLQQPDGSFAYQRHRRYTNRVVYARWSVAWMFCALAALSAEIPAE